MKENNMGEFIEIKEDIKARICEVLEENGIPVEDIDWEQQIEIDSLSYMSLMVCIEEEFEIDIPVEFFMEMRELSCKKIYENVIKLMN